MKVYQITDNIYHATIFVIPEYDDKKLIRYFRKTFGHDYKPDNTIDGMHYALTNGETGVVAHYLIFKAFTNSSDGISLLFHEIYHLVCSIMREVGMVYSEDSEEAFSYYIQCLTKKILERLVK